MTSEHRGPSIWMYWESTAGAGRPPYLDACEATIRMNAGSLPVIVMDERTASDFGAPLPTAWSEMSPVQRADWLRVRVVLRHGGIWVDADTIVLQPLEQLLTSLSEERSFLGHGADGVHNNLFAGLAGSAFLAAWASRQEAVLGARDPRELSWNDLGSSIAEALAEDVPWIRVDHERIAPIGWRDWELLLSHTHPLGCVLKSDPITVMLYNAQMGQRLRSTEVSALLNGLTLTGRLLRHGLGLKQRRLAIVGEALHPVGRMARRVRERSRQRARSKERAR